MLAGIVLSVTLLLPRIQEHFVPFLISQGRYTDALPILEAARNRPSPNLAPLLNQLGDVYYQLGRLRDAQQAFEQALEVHRQRGETATHDLALTLNNLGMLYTRLNLFTKAEQTIGQAVEIHRGFGNELGEAQSLLNLGSACRAEHRPEQAASLFRQALDLRDKMLAPDHPDIAVAANNLAVALQELNRLDEAEPLLVRALSIWENAAGPANPMVAAALNNLGVLYTHLGKFDLAEPRLSRAVAIATQVLPPDHPNLASYRFSYAVLLRKLDRKKEAQQLEAAARQSRQRFDRANALGLTVDARQSFH
jgi:tetratricopeptide (TPR) repeat protein